MAACEAAGGGRVVVPRGTWTSGAIHLRSNCELHLADGAEIVFSQDPSDYLPAVPTTAYGLWGPPAFHYHRAADAPTFELQYWSEAIIEWRYTSADRQWHVQDEMD